MTAILSTLNIEPQAIFGKQVIIPESIQSSLGPAPSKTTEPLQSESLVHWFSWLSFPQRGVYHSHEAPLQEALLNNSNLLLI